MNEVVTGETNEAGELSPKHESIGHRIINEGPGVVLDEIESALPARWRDHVVEYPMTAISIGFLVGFFLGLKKSRQLLAAGSSMVSAAATAGLERILAGRGD